MANATQKITLSASRDIPFNQLVLSQSNVRRIKAGVSIEELAEDIARRGLLQGLSVRAVRNEAGEETGLFEIPAGGRRYRALELLVKRKRLARTAPVPCILREVGLAEEDSLAENVQRAPLHPLDQFRAFLALKEKGQWEEEIAATFFVSVQVVKQRLKLASVLPKLLDVYAEDGMTLDQLMAFTVSHDHDRQEQVFERLRSSSETQPYVIRRWLTEGAVRAADNRAQFVGVDAYVAAGGSVLRDLFQGDDGGWLQDMALLDRMVAEKLREEACAIEAEGWKWTEVAPDFPYGHTLSLRQLRGTPVAISPAEQATRDALQAQDDALLALHKNSPELPDEVDERLGELGTAIEALDERPVVFDSEEVALAGAFVSIASDGRLRVERGYVRPQDEPPVDDPMPQGFGEAIGVPDDDGEGLAAEGEGGSEPELEADDGGKPLPERLVSELTAYRTIALRQALSEQPDTAFLAVLHALTLRVFYHHGQDSCLDVDLRSVGFPAQAPGLAASRPARALARQQERWSAHLPMKSEALWDTVVGFDEDSRQALFAFVVSQSVNAVIEPYTRRPRAIAHADRLAQSVDLDLTAAGWRPTVGTYLGRVTKARILAAVAEARGQRAADRIAHLKKSEMAKEAEGILEGSGWLSEPLRTPGRSTASFEHAAPAAASEGEGAAEELLEASPGEGAPNESGPAIGDDDPAEEGEEDQFETFCTVAAE